LTLIDRQIAALTRAGIREITVVVGAQADRVRQHCGDRATYVENTRFAETNSLYSLWLARHHLTEGFVVLNCDVLFHPQLLEDLLTTRYEAAAMVAYRQPFDPAFGDEEMKVSVRGGRVVAMSKSMSPADADGENVGLLRFDAPAVPALARCLDAIVGSGGLREWAPSGFSAFAEHHPLYAIGTRGYPWIEIDFPEDLEQAVRHVLPLIDPASAPMPRPVTRPRIATRVSGR